MLHETGSPQTLGLVRIWVFGLWFVQTLNFSLWERAGAPNFEPVGVLKLIPAAAWNVLNTTVFYQGVIGALLFLLSALILGVGPYRFLAVVTCVLLTFSQGIARSFDYIGHNELVLLYAAYVLAVFPAADALSLRRKRNLSYSPAAVYQAPLVTIALVFSLTYMFVGARRLAVGGLEIFLDGTILHQIALRDAETGLNSLGYGLAALERPWLGWLLQLGFPIVTLFELLSPLALFYRRWRWLWLSVILSFHVANTLLMDVWFTYNMLLLPVFFTNIDRMVRNLLPCTAEARPMPAPTSDFFTPHVPPPAARARANVRAH